MRISDWSSDVCSSDLLEKDGRRIGVEGKPPPEEGGRRIDRIAIDPEPGRAKFGLKAQRSGGPLRRCPDRGGDDRHDRTDLAPKDPIVHYTRPFIKCRSRARARPSTRSIRSEERREGKEGGSTCNTRGSPK